MVVQLLYDFGPQTKEGVADLLAKEKKMRTVPSPHSLSSLLCKNSQVVVVGSEKVENAVGALTKHLVYDVDREIIQTPEDIIYTRSPTVMTPKQKKVARKCGCGRIRVYPPDSDRCIYCAKTHDRKD